MSSKPEVSTAADVTPDRAKRKLGRGLGALLGETHREESVAPSEGGTALSSAAGQGEGGAGAPRSGLASIPVARIEPLPGQPRQIFDDEALDDLARSIAQRGVIQPVIVRPLERKGRYQLVAGERRWRAAQRAKLHEIPAIIRDLDQREVMAIALIENIQREDLNPIEEARAYQHLADEEGMSQAEIAELVDKSRSHVANHQRLLALPAKVIAYVERGQLSMGHARALIGDDAAEMLAEEAVTRNLSVRDVEKRVRSKGGASGRASSAKPSKSGSHESEDIAAVERHLEEFLGMSLKIKPDADPSSGAITIKYKTLDQLDLLCQRLTGGKI
ncbi:chromosome partitioning protein ParB [Citromicrobium sp. RCC1885]|uniref:ParB/RepB/Spo0J family partition protein n=1 Tax=unclassified Citromicrobium TaxID=2630544 RepID=UPI0006C8E888|nr:MULTISPECIES: ParB/RepB/Spo0J family partition protein [unclassified Citromicrobium]KPM21306.1 chromosome partitioning protein ParB [Citromicrobium sp. RCC1885]KPM29386.1 chromosome partitioning protein ParB [Citromicrobium sp. RCC1878]OAM06653.1 chromosome partitioning protein ParB [Citromicrobium sp. RCC1897]|tara:strand:- start:7182 stop:8174 length:993 start_codon:yes stop_codon:yes gene_type:complete